MTHDELLAEIDMAYGLISYAETSDQGLKALQIKDYFNALRAVVELHKPVTTTIGSFCKTCGITSNYPCETIQAIEKELG